MGIQVTQSGSLARLLFAGYDSQKKQLKRVTDDCVYCGDSFSQTGNKKKQVATFDHIRPQDSFKNSGLPKHETANGFLACAPCNNSRDNIPVLEFLQGEGRHFSYSGGENDMKVSPNTSQNEKEASKRHIQRGIPPVPQRKAHFSNYLKAFVIQQASVNGSPEPNSWFIKAMDNIMFPIWKEGVKPKDEVTLTRHFNQRVKLMVRLLSDADKNFWLGKQFEHIIQTDFAQHRMKQQALLQSIRELRNEQAFAAPATVMFGRNKPEARSA